MQADPYLEVGVAEDVGSGVEVLYLLEGAHDLGPDHAALLVYQLDRGPEKKKPPRVNKQICSLFSQICLLPLSVVGDAIPDHHVELVFIVLDPEHHGHGLTDLDDSRHLRGVRTLSDLTEKKLSARGMFSQIPEAHLDLHPAAEVVSQKVGGDRVQHVHLIGLERHRLLIKVIPGDRDRGKLAEKFSVMISLIETNYMKNHSGP